MYSLLDGFSEPEDYLKRATEIGLKAFAITEHGNMYSYIYFDKLKNKYPNIKMLYGVELYECFSIEEKNKESWIARNTRRIKRKLGIKKL